MNPRAIKQGGFKRKMVKKEWVNRLDGHEWRDNQNRRRHDVKTIKIRLHGCKRWIFFFVTWFNLVGTTHFSFQWWLHFFLFLMASFVEWYSFFKRAAKRHPGWFTVGCGVGLLQPPRWGLWYRCVIFPNLQSFLKNVKKPPIES